MINLCKSAIKILTITCCLLGITTTLVAHFKYSVDPEKCAGAAGLMILLTYFSVYSDTDFRMAHVSVFFLFLSFVVGAENLKTHIEVVSTIKLIKDFLN